MPYSLSRKYPVYDKNVLRQAVLSEEALASDEQCPVVLLPGCAVPIRMRTASMKLVGVSSLISYEVCPLEDGNGLKQSVLLHYLHNTERQIRFLNY